MILDLETLRAIGEWGWVVYFAALCILFFIFIRKKYISSSLVVILITTIITLFMNEYRDFMLVVISDKEFIEQNRTLVRYAWYYGFAAFNAMLMLAVYKAHVALKLSYCYTARYLMFAHFVLSLLQISRCFERQSFNTNYLEALYQWGIVAINMSCSGLALVFAVMALYQELKNKTTRGFL